MSDAAPHQNPSLPADYGLPALGLVCQGMALFVTLYLVLLAFVGILPYTLGGPRVALIGVLALGAIRAGLHNAAGKALIARSPLVFAAVRRYIIAAIATTLTTGALLTLLVEQMPFIGYVLFALLSLAWPAALGLLVFRRPVRAAFEAADTFDLSLVPRDRSVEGVGVLMTVLAAIGLAVGVLALVLVGEVGLGGIEGVLLILFVALLVVRAALHLDGGVRAIRGVTAQRFDRLVQRYVYVAVGTVGALALFLLIASHGRGLPMLIVTLLLASGMLLTWPVVLRRFANQVLLDDVGDEDQAPFGAAPDRGLTAFGYLLVVMGVHQLVLQLAALLVGSPDIGMLAAGAIEDTAFDPMNLVGLAAGLVALWAAREALTMSARRRLAMDVYAGFTIGAAMMTWFADGFPLETGHTAAAIPAVVAMIAVQLAVPLTGVVLVRRKLPPADEVTPPRGVPVME
ncbi:MAG: hypothetical protein EP329_18975 [Deltaproteobacteria bacterium]|nr:MAG: hypothetical protein EP329_18975 [Deltaproteobacteria bacterium]